MTTEEVDGRSLVPILENQTVASWRKRFLLEHWDVADTEPIPTFAGVRTASTDTPSNVLYVEYEAFPAEDVGAQFEYYDLDTDADQLTNAYGTCGAICTALSVVLTDLQNCGLGTEDGDPCKEVED